MTILTIANQQGGVGKTSLLSTPCNYLQPAWRIVKIEDPEESWIDRKTVQTVEARPKVPGSEVPAYTLADGVDDAMGMSPGYPDVGEMSDGRVTMTLLKEEMTQLGTTRCKSVRQMDSYVRA